MPKLTADTLALLIDNSKSRISTINLSSKTIPADGNLNINLEKNTQNYVIQNNSLPLNEYIPLAGGLNNSVYTIKVDSNNLVYVGGNFTAAYNGVNYTSPISTSHIATWNGSIWSPLLGGLNGIVNAIAIDSNNNVYAGGLFTTANNTSTITVSNIAKWNGSEWSALAGGLNNYLNAIAIDSNNNVYAGGSFTIANNNSSTINVNYIAKWDVTTNEWGALGGGLSGVVQAIAIDSNNNIYAGGSFTNAINNSVINTNSTISSNYIAKWDVTTNQWVALAGGLSGIVYSIAIDSNDNVYAGGIFTQANNDNNSIINVNYIAKWNGSSWSSLAGGISSDVYAIAVDSQDNIFVGGLFETAYNLNNSPINTYRIGKWNGTEWLKLNEGCSITLYTIAIDANDNVYAGGLSGDSYFYNSYNSPIVANGIGKWNGINWSPLNGGIGNNVWTIAIGQNNIFFGSSGQTCWNGPNYLLPVYGFPVVANYISCSSLPSTTPWNISLSVNSKLVYYMTPNMSINLNVSDSGEPDTNGPVV